MDYSYKSLLQPHGPVHTGNPFDVDTLTKRIMEAPRTDSMTDNFSFNYFATKHTASANNQLTKTDSVDQNHVGDSDAMLKPQKRIRSNRMKYSEVQKDELEKCYQQYDKYVPARMRDRLAKTLGLSQKQVKIWFQNRRSKQRKINRNWEMMKLASLPTVNSPESRTESPDSLRSESETDSLLGSTPPFVLPHVPLSNTSSTSVYPDFRPTLPMQHYPQFPMLANDLWSTDYPLFNNGTPFNPYFQFTGVPPSYSTYSQHHHQPYQHYQQQQYVPSSD